jgi:hypothetical protein
MLDMVKNGELDRTTGPVPVPVPVPAPRAETRAVAAAFAARPAGPR